MLKCWLSCTYFFNVLESFRNTPWLSSALGSRRRHGLRSPLGALRLRGQQAAAGGRRLLGRATPRAFGELSLHREAAALRGNRKAKAIAGRQCAGAGSGVSHSLPAPPRSPNPPTLPRRLRKFRAFPLGGRGRLRPA